MFLPLEKNDDLKNDYTVLHFIINSSIFMSEEVLDFSERGGRLLFGLMQLWHYKKKLEKIRKMNISVLTQRQMRSADEKKRRGEV